MDGSNTKKIDGTVLLVDDEPGIIELYSEVLGDAGFSVDTASNGNEALMKLSEKEYAIVLLDIMMNEGPDGLEVLRTIKSNPDKYKKPIVVMLTNVALTNNIMAAYEYGAEGYLRKLALSNEQLVKKVKGYLNGFGD